jgi:hypothetical protein
MAAESSTVVRMRREQYKTPDEDVVAEFERVCRLFRLALGEPSDRVLFDALMAEANERGLNWVQGLEYVIEQRGIEVEGAPVPAGVAAGATLGAAEQHQPR